MLTFRRQFKILCLFKNLFIYSSSTPWRINKSQTDIFSLLSTTCLMLTFLRKSCGYVFRTRGCYSSHFSSSFNNVFLNFYHQRDDCLGIYVMYIPLVSIMYIKSKSFVTLGTLISSRFLMTSFTNSHFRSVALKIPAWASLEWNLLTYFTVVMENLFELFKIWAMTVFFFIKLPYFFPDSWIGHRLFSTITVS